MSSDKELIEEIKKKAGIETDSDKMKKSLTTLFSLVITFFLESWLLMLLWNALLPDLVGVGTITFWQTCGLKILVTNLLPGNIARVKNGMKK